jgi:methyl-accepting chemotaxis protein
VAGLIAEITSASQEQAQGVDQVNTAVAQMDKVTQTNAANAEESASASEELSAQAEQLRDLVVQLSAMVGGSAEQTGGNASRLPARRPTPAASRPPARQGSNVPTVVKPNDAIPFDDDGDDEFADF